MVHIQCLSVCTFIVAILQTSAASTSTTVATTVASSTATTPSSTSSNTISPTTTQAPTSTLTTNTSVSTTTNATSTPAGSSSTASVGPTTVTTPNVTQDTNGTTITTVVTTTSSIIECRNGTCSGNNTACIANITDTCVLDGTDQCYQRERVNGTELIYYEVGCKDDCEYLEETTDDVTWTTRCCNTDMCTDELLSDPGSGTETLRMRSVDLVLTLMVIFLAPNL